MSSETLQTETLQSDPDTQAQQQASTVQNTDNVSITHAYSAITTFVNELNSEFNGRYKPVALYALLLAKAGANIQAKEKHLAAFTKFFNENPGYIKKALLHNNAKVVYSDTIFLDMNQILAKTNKNTRACIHKHMLTIHTLLSISQSSPAAADALQTLKDVTGPSTADIASTLNLPDTNEGKFIKDAFTGMVSQFQNLESDTNMMDIMSGMAQSGFIQKFMGTLQEDVQSGKMDVKALLGTITSVVAGVAPAESPEGAHLRSLAQKLESKYDANADSTAEDLQETLGTDMLSPEMLSSVMGMMGALNVQPPNNEESVEDSIDKVD